MNKIIIASFLLAFSIPGVLSAADVNGTIAIVLNSGDIKYGAKVDVLLTTKAVSVIPVTEDPAMKYKYQMAVIESLGEAWKAVVSETKRNPLYIKSKTTTNLSGKFKFQNPDPGMYFLVVTFPTQIAMHGVFWQVPIEILNKDIEIELSNDNMALPAHLFR